ncbi:hypothetical protein FGO68_gene15634 [Halteria grandinella]|uniref:Protein yippee-like n=1 Tax=Halteria grandinella TaxID=5974 RepID=A0A8J8P505_HALGN|nr:hypothetical protein FGO68_gene15634 [Halteria grandinella]
MGFLPIEHLDLKEYKMSCKYCLVPLFYTFEIISHDYKCKNGKAFFVALVRNVILGDTYTTTLTSGKVDLANIYCVNCHNELGFKYIKTYVDQNSFKQERFMVDCSKVT